MVNRNGWRRITLLAIGYGLGFVSGGVVAWLLLASPDPTPTCERTHKALFRCSTSESTSRDQPGYTGMWRDSPHEGG